MVKPHQNHYQMQRPCADCPFRSDRVFYLTRERVDEIEQTTNMFPFSCHKTVDYEERKADEYEQAHCAGVLILREKLHQPSVVMRLAQELGFYDPSKLDMTAPVYNSWEEMKRAMSEEIERRKK